MQHQPRPRPTTLPGRSGVDKKPLPNARPMETYRALQGEKIRQYHSIGDPVQDMQAKRSMRRLAFSIALLVGAIILIVIFMKR